MSAIPMVARKEGFPHRVSFVLVNDRVPHASADCALCGCKIEKGYVRERLTRLLYCDAQCFVGHAIAMKSRARQVS
jgi:hypothetical protein